MNPTYLARLQSLVDESTDLTRAEVDAQTTPLGEGYVVCPTRGGDPVASFHGPNAQHDAALFCAAGAGIDALVAALQEARTKKGRGKVESTTPAPTTAPALPAASDVVLRRLLERALAYLRGEAAEGYHTPPRNPRAADCERLVAEIAATLREVHGGD